MYPATILPSMEPKHRKYRSFHTSKVGTKLTLINNNLNHNNISKVISEEEENSLKAYLSGNYESIEEYASKVRNNHTSKHSTKHRRKVKTLGDKLTPREAAEYLGKSYKTVDKYLNTGKLPFEWGQGPTGPARLISLEVLEAFKHGRPIPSMEPPQQESIEETPETLELSMESTQDSNLPSLESMPDQALLISKVQLEKIEERIYEKISRENEKWREEFEQRQVEREQRFEKWVKERDYKLMETVRAIQEAQEEAKKKRPWWARLWR